MTVRQHAEFHLQNANLVAQIEVDLADHIADRIALRAHQLLHADMTGIDTHESTVCRSGEVLQGLIKPHECEAFGTLCTPRNPLGATMVSSEGACAAYYLYRRLETPVLRPGAAAPKEVTSVG